ncbi:MAG TPA: hypothetical protein DEB40_00540 [Elusimicrobia bacterium]|nr:hypothetical protein [Elusimicrobiota bacterium]HBT60219.1 hypothetical protein [Elusimicrobiota bacterium]
MPRNEDRGPRFKRRHRFLLRSGLLGLLLAWLCLMGWPTRPGPFAYNWRHLTLLAASLLAAFLAARRLRRTNPMGLRDYLAKRQSGLLLTGACFCGLLAAEWTARIMKLAEWGAGQGPLQPSFRLAQYDINAQGFRGGNFPLPEDRTAVNILGLGDSFAFGQGVKWEDTFLKRVEESLNRQRQGRKPVRTLNASRPGWNTNTESMFLEQYGRLFEPAVAIVAFTLNDAEIEPYALLPITGQDWEQLWLWRSHLFFLLVKAYNLRIRPYENFITGLYGDDQASWRYCQEALRRIVFFCRQTKTTPLLVIFPILQDMDDYRFAALHRKVREAGQAAGFDVLDLLESFRNYPQPTRNLRVSRGDWHPNAEGHRLAAEAILTKLKELKIPAGP